MYPVLRELLPKNRFLPRRSHEKRRAADRAITSGPTQPVVASPVTHRPVRCQIQPTRPTRSKGAWARGR